MENRERMKHVMDMESGTEFSFSVKNGILLLLGVVICVYMYVNYYYRTNNSVNEAAKKSEMDQKMKIARQKRIQQLEKEMELNKEKIKQQKEKEQKEKEKREKEKEREKTLSRNAQTNGQNSSTFDHFHDNTRYYRPSIKNRYAGKS